MTRPLQGVIDYFAAEPVRVSAILRLPLIGLSRKGTRVVLTVDDDGTGFDPAIVAQYVAGGHIGLGSLLARFYAMGGSMAIQSRHGHGTQVTVTPPPGPNSSQ